MISLFKKHYGGIEGILVFHVIKTFVICQMSRCTFSWMGQPFVFHDLNSFVKYCTQDFGLGLIHTKMENTRAVIKIFFHVDISVKISQHVDTS